MGGPGSGRKPSQITPKQAEVADLVCTGKTLVEASMILGLNVNSAKSRWRKVKEKLDATRDTLAVARYVELKLKEQI